MAGLRLRNTALCKDALLTPGYKERTPCVANIVTTSGLGTDGIITARVDWFAPEE
jgi:hypothetical protein